MPAILRCRGLISLLLLCYALSSTELIFPLVDSLLPYVIKAEGDYLCAGHDCCCKSKEDCENNCCCQKENRDRPSSKNSEKSPQQLKIKALMECSGTLPLDSNLKVMPMDVHLMADNILWTFFQRTDRYFIEIQRWTPHSWKALPQEPVPWTLMVSRTSLV